MEFAIGIDIGGTFTKLVLLGEDGEILAEGHLPTETDSGAEGQIARCVDHVHDIARRCGRRLADARAVGVGVAGLIDVKAGVVCAAPNLPAAYTRLIDGLAIGPHVGSCGAAAWRGKTVIVSDTETDPLWQDFRGIAAQFNLRACWSTPIMTHGHLLFALVITAYVFIGTALEERDLLRHLGDDYRRYREETPMLVPMPKKKKRPSPARPAST